jgi:hypothetical protein
MHLADEAAVTAEWFLNKACENPVIAGLLAKLPALDVEQCYLTAGCLFQTVWNYRSGLPLENAIKDYDVFYFNDQDLSWEAEDKIIRRANSHLGSLAKSVEMKNQARVHLWYRERFGRPCPELRSATDGIDRYLISCTCIGINVKTKALYAPNGLDDMWEGILRMNPRNPQADLFHRRSQPVDATHALNLAAGV